MSRLVVLSVLVLCLVSLTACQQKVPEPEIDMQALRQAVLKKTEQIYLIHLKLDTAITEITSAETKARGSDCTGSEYHAAEAYRNVQQADEALLQLGRELQEMFNLDVARANRN